MSNNEITPTHYAVTDCENKNYITAGKRYPITDVCPIGFYMIDDGGVEKNCCFKDCAHLDGNDWKIGVISRVSR